MSDQWRAYLVGKNPAEQSEGGKDHAEQKRDGSVIVTNDNRHIYPQTTKEERKKPNWVEKGTLFVLTLTLIAAGYAGFEAHRLAELTKKAVFDSERTATQQTADTAQSLKIAKEAAAATTAANAALTQAGEMHEQAATSRNQLIAFEREARIRLRATCRL